MVHVCAPEVSLDGNSLVSATTVTVAAVAAVHSGVLKRQQAFAVRVEAPPAVTVPAAAAAKHELRVPRL